jgi:hypothetical protein
VTKLTKAVRRKLDSIERHGLVITLYPGGTIGLRAGKTRREHVVTVSRVYRLALEMTAENNRRIKEKAKDAARIAKGLPPRRRLVSRGLLATSKGW